MELRRGKGDNVEGRQSVCDLSMMAVGELGQEQEYKLSTMLDDLGSRCVATKPLAIDEDEDHMAQ